MTGTARTAAILLTLLISLYAAAVCTRRYANTYGVDFYHYWALPRVVALSEGPPGSPYVETASYADVLRRDAAQSEDRRYQDAERFRRRLDLTGTPLSYAIGGALPGGYSRAFAVYEAGLALALVGAALAAARAHGRELLGAAGLAGALLAGAHPVAIDAHVGNVGAWQLLGLTLLCAGVARAPLSVLGAGLAALVLLKPSVLAPCLGLGLCALARAARVRGGVRALGAGAGVAGAALIAWPALVFGAPGVWGDWLGALGGVERLVYTPEQGNWSLVRALSDASGVEASALSRLVLGGLGLSLAGALGARALARGGGRAGLRGALSELLADPWGVAGLGVIATLLGSPIVWVHYFTLAILPALALAWGPGSRALSQAAILGFVGVGTFAQALPLDPFLGTWRAPPLLYALSGLLFWSALLARVVRGPPAAGEAEAAPLDTASLIAWALVARAGLVGVERLSEGALTPGLAAVSLGAAALGAVALARRAGWALGLGLAALALVDVELGAASGGAGAYLRAALLLPALALLGGGRVELACGLIFLLSRSSALAYLCGRMLGIELGAAAPLGLAALGVGGLAALARWGRSRGA